MKSLQIISNGTSIGAGIGFFAGTAVMACERGRHSYIDLSPLQLFIGTAAGAGAGFLVGVGLVIANKTLNKETSNPGISDTAINRSMR